MRKLLTNAVLLALILLVVAPAGAQTRRYRQRPAAEPPAPAIPVDKRDSVVGAPGAFNGKAYWLGLAECGGIYFKLNTFYADAAARARVVKPDARANADMTKKLNDAIRTATTYFDAAESFLMTDRHIERPDAVLTYDRVSRAAGERFKNADTALAATKACPALYEACQAAHPKQCNEAPSPAG